MESLDVIEYVGPCLIQGSIAPAMNTLALEYSEEPLTSSIVAAVPDSAHTTYHAITAKEALVIATGELTTAI
ncbi:hypothetical protein SAMN04487960_1196 [Marinobacter mobilis]|uniref:Uncharacterized protein n=1 Tax=Marinobacter mobilis TaxID=488533 RepID=A0A1H3BVS6_9GAMM|nr:hypothetical protein SAMN04487960_109183 [Marinobacter mobilis]SDX71548.1 hypothetical protein SAMN04487960_1151 [Marinobacter mobilis]SDX75352.1 hypothetical protein SAMN04487960_1196 [Marinobacter mobilis]